VETDDALVAQVLGGAEAGSLAREMARAYAGAVDFYRAQMELDLAEADAKARQVTGWDEEKALTADPDQVFWGTLSRLMEGDPEKGLAAWERLKAEARDELASGHRAAAALEWDGSPMERARFLAVRSAFIAEWRPRGGLELALIDTLAQAHTQYLFWMNRLHVHSVTEASRHKHQLKSKGEWEPPRVEAAEWVREAAEMADRFNRLFLRTLRHLRDLRRYGGPVIVQSAGQVNVGAHVEAQQVSVAVEAERGGE
jgi:hypothetical protein